MTSPTIRLCLVWLIMVCGCRLDDRRAVRSARAVAGLPKTVAAVNQAAQRLADRTRKVALFQAVLDDRKIDSILRKEVTARGAFFIVKNVFTEGEPELSRPDKVVRYIDSPRPEGSWNDDPPALEFTRIDIDDELAKVSLRYEGAGMHFDATFRWVHDHWHQEEHRWWFH